ncbi:unnamed protein product [Didymodactylos carnosus]|uniref:Uncharacterized protein n=1 Tax=Didymodactylos carnosus TaxID=1234261 RepID=A0A815UPW1_9BILA|nr:unnamed protein product [Didymodactylos carnosus]CAF4382052.1 unnamed protein product [Didymodactylos carnosus]
MYYTPLNTNAEKVSFILPETLAEEEVLKLQQYISSSLLAPVDIYVYKAGDTSTVKDGELYKRRESFAQESLNSCSIVRDIFDESELMEKLQGLISQNVLNDPYRKLFSAGMYSKSLDKTWLGKLNNIRTLGLSTTNLSKREKNVEDELQRQYHDKY